MEPETSNELTVVIQQSGVEQSTALTLQTSFMPFFQQAKEWDEKAKSLVVTDVSQVREMKMAREARLALRDIRINADKTRKSLKEDSLRYGKAVQGVYNVIDYLIAPIEKHLEDQEKFAERLEAKRKADLKEQRDTELLPYLAFVPYQIDLGELGEEAWATVLNGAKLQYQAKIQQDIQAETDRIAREKADAEERERIKAENERLKAEAIEREKAAEAARIKADADRLALEEQNRKAEADRQRLAEIERKKQAEELAKLEAARLAAAKILEQERAASAKLSAELKAKQDAEEAERVRLAKVESDRIAAEKKAAKAPEKDQLRAWMNSIVLPLTPMVKSDEAQVITLNITEKFSSFKKWALTQIETL